MPAYSELSVPSKDVEISPTVEFLRSRHHEPTVPDISLADDNSKTRNHNLVAKSAPSSTGRSATIAASLVLVALVGAIMFLSNTTTSPEVTQSTSASPAETERRQLVVDVPVESFSFEDDIAGWTEPEFSNVAPSFNTTDARHGARSVQFSTSSATDQAALVQNVDLSSSLPTHITVSGWAKTVGEIAASELNGDFQIQVDMADYNFQHKVAGSYHFALNGEWDEAVFDIEEPLGMQFINIWLLFRPNSDANLSVLFDDITVNNMEAPQNPCLPSPCVSGTCQEMADASFLCVCDSGFYGDICDIQDPCLTGMCENGGECQFDPVTNTASCTCAEGFFGYNCNLIDLCYSNPCFNDAVCSTDGTDVFCDCPDGFDGALCQYNNPCEFPDPCVSGTCTVVDIAASEYSCECTPGIIGTNCDIDDPCSPNPCNGETCTATELYTAECTCPPNKSGEFCEIIDFCYENNQCLNGGQCVNGDSGFTCDCAEGFAGTFCGQDANPCNALDCNTGDCVIDDVSGDAVCQCPEGFTGAACEIELCNPNPCMNGDCAADGDTEVCTCNIGWEGEFCDVLDLCHDHSCQNGAACSHDGSQLTCNCPAGFSGDLCETNDVCGFCQNGGTCSTAAGECVCPVGFSGANCETGFYNWIADPSFENLSGDWTMSGAASTGETDDALAGLSTAEIDAVVGGSFHQQQAFNVWTNKVLVGVWVAFRDTTGAGSAGMTVTAHIDSPTPSTEVYDVPALATVGDYTLLEVSIETAYRVAAIEVDLHASGFASGKVHFDDAHAVFARDFASTVAFQPEWATIFTDGEVASFTRTAVEADTKSGMYKGVGIYQNEATAQPLKVSASARITTPTEFGYTPVENLDTFVEIYADIHFAAIGGVTPNPVYGRRVQFDLSNKDWQTVTLVVDYAPNPINEIWLRFNTKGVEGTFEVTQPTVVPIVDIQRQVYHGMPVLAKTLIIVDGVDRNVDYFTSRYAFDSHGVPYDAWVVGSEPPQLVSDGVGQYSGIVVANAANLNFVSQGVQRQLRAYEANFGAKRAVFATDPATVAWADRDGAYPWGSYSAFDIVRDPSADVNEYFVGLNPEFRVGGGETMMTYPATVNHASAEAFLRFESVADFGSSAQDHGVAAVKKVESFGREELHFFYRTHQFHEKTRLVFTNYIIRFLYPANLYPGERKSLVLPQIDDLFLSTESWDEAAQANTGPAYRTSVGDMDWHVNWLNDLNSNLPAGADITLEFAVNGLGVEEAGGAQADPLFQRSAELAQSGVFEWCHHTYTHPFMDEGYTYAEAEKEINDNNVHAKELFGVAGSADITADNWNPRTLVHPSHSGSHNGEVLQALWDAGLRGAPFLVERMDAVWPSNPDADPILHEGFPTNWDWWSHHGRYTTQEHNGFDGYFMIPRIGSLVSFDASTPAEEEHWWNVRSDWSQQRFGSTGHDLHFIFAERVKYDVHFMLAFRHDPVMFHQGNMRVFDWEEKLGFLYEVGQTRPASLVSLFMEYTMFEIQKYYTLPILTEGMDSVLDRYQMRMKRDLDADISYVVHRNTLHITANGSFSGTVDVPITGAVPAQFGVAQTQYGPDLVSVVTLAAGESITLRL